jgi:hypothetical protein
MAWHSPEFIVNNSILGQILGRAGMPHRGRYFTLSSGQDLVDKVDKVTREENSTKSVFLVTKIVRQKTIVRIKSSLSTFLPCLPGLAFTDHIKNLPL